MFGWLRKSSKEPTGVNEPQSFDPQKNQYVHVDDRITVKALDLTEDSQDDDDKDYVDRPHSVTAARPFFQAQQHLEQQQIKQEVIQPNYMSDNDELYAEISETEDDNEPHSEKKKKKWKLFKHKKDNKHPVNNIYHLYTINQS